MHCNTWLFNCDWTADLCNISVPCQSHITPTLTAAGVVIAWLNVMSRYIDESQDTLRFASELVNGRYVTQEQGS